MSSIIQQLSEDGSHRVSKVMLEFNVRKKVSSRINRLKFLKECIAEQVLPASVPTHEP